MFSVHQVSLLLLRLSAGTEAQTTRELESFPQNFALLVNLL